MTSFGIFGTLLGTANSQENTTPLRYGKLQVEKSGPIFEGTPDLADVPIDDPQHERTLLESGWGTLLQDLARRVGGAGYINPAARGPRIIEIYRRCYEESEIKGRKSVLQRFVAHFPHLAVKADWVAKVVSLSLARNDTDILLAMARGFKKAADPAARQKRSVNQLLLEEAREFREKVFAEDLDPWNRSLNRNLDPTDDWIRERSENKVAELLTKYPELKTVRGKLRLLLCANQMYEASILISARHWNVSPRRLERK